MKNGKFNTYDVKTTCEKKLNIVFRSNGEFNGWYCLDGNKTCRITIPKGRKNIRTETYKSMARQLKLSIQDFDELLECPLTPEKYVVKLRERLSNEN